MALPDFITNNIDLIRSNPGPFIVFSFLMFGVAWFIFTLIHKEHIAVLQERLASKDDTITSKEEETKYYKELLETKQSPSSSSQTTTQKQPDNLHSAILREIEYLEQNAGRAISMQLFERLQIKYPFIVILGELLTMNKKGEVQWAEAPNPPDALSVLTVLKRKE